MFQNIGAQCGKTVRNETLPACIFPLRMFQSIPNRQQCEAQDHQRLSLAQAVADIAELEQPGIGIRAGRGIEGADKPGQRYIPLK